MRHGVYFLILFFAAVNTLDCVTTILCINFANGYEMNPFARELMEERIYEPIKILPSVAATVIARPAADRMELVGKLSWVIIVVTVASTALLTLAVVNNVIILLGFEQPEQIRAFVTTLYGE